MQLFSHYLWSQQTATHTKNWQNHMIGDGLLYAARNTSYNARTYPSDLHYHDYYELVIFERGNIRYVCESRVYYPTLGDIVLIPPGKFHMSAINDEHTQYKRHVFYFYPSAFDQAGFSCLFAFLKEQPSHVLFSLLSHTDKQELMGLLHELERTLSDENDPQNQALAFSYVLQIFYRLNKKLLRSEHTAASLPENIRRLRQYIDENYAQISSVSQIARHFFYSREYVSRLFKKHFDITVSDYILKRRVAESQIRIAQGAPIIDAAYGVGFGSLSAFIRAFRLITGMTPSAYRKAKKT